MGGVGQEGGKSLYVLRHKPSAPIEVIEMLSEVEVVECKHSCTDGTLKEVVHGNWGLKFGVKIQDFVDESKFLLKRFVNAQ